LFYGTSMLSFTLKVLVVEIIYIKMSLTLANFNALFKLIQSVYTTFYIEQFQQN